MANFDFNMFKKKASEVADKTVLLAKKATDKAVETAKIAKLNADISLEKEKLKKAYQQIGKIYYDLHKDAPEAEMVQAVDAVNAVKEVIKKKRAEIAALKVDECADDICDVSDKEKICDIECEPIEEDGIPETEEAVEDEDIFADIETEDSIPETEETPISDEIAE